MLVNANSPSPNSGTTGVAVAAQAEKLVAMLWEQVLSGMAATALPAGALGAGSNVYEGMALHAVANSVFAGVDGGLSQDMVKQLGGEPATSPTPSIAGSSLEVLQSLSGGSGGTAIHAAGPTVAATGTPTKVAMPAGMIGRATAFAQKLWPDLKQAASRLDVPPVGLLAQAALETGWGSAVPGNNLFGVKASNGDASVSLPTKEMVNGNLVPTVASFATYPSISSAVDHLVSLIETRFQGALGSTSVEQFATALANGGYATDNAYAQKIINVARSPIMDHVLQTLIGG